MAINQCLYEEWLQRSAQVFHTSSVWPSFSAASIDAFLAGEADAPVASRLLDLDKVRDVASRIRAFTNFAHDSPITYACAETYIQTENERLQVLNLFEQHSSAEAVDEINSVLYGSLEDLHYTEALQYLKFYLLQLAPQSAAVAKAKEVILSEWIDIEPSDSILKYFDAMTEYKKQLGAITKHTFAFIEDIPVELNESGMCSPVSAKQYMTHALRQLFLDSNWSIELSDSAPNVHIDYEKSSVVMPANRDFSLQHLKGLIVHEMGVHITRSRNGAASKERLAGYGLAGYGAAEEAFGSMLETSIYPARHSPFSVLAIAFSTIHFALAHVNESFRNIYDRVLAMMLCIDNPSEDEYAVSANSYARRSFSRTQRVCRMGTAQLIDRSVTKYWSGILQLQDYFATNQITPELVSEFLEGKYDIRRPEQLQLIRTHSL